MAVLFGRLTQKGKITMMRSNGLHMRFCVSSSDVQSRPTVLLADSDYLRKMTQLLSHCPLHVKWRKVFFLNKENFNF